jgi:hypothetical protein
MAKKSTAAAAAGTTRTLTLRLAGRICIVEHVVKDGQGGSRKSYSALFLNTRHNKQLGVAKHKPALCGSFERIKAAIPRRGDAAFAEPSGREVGLWSIKGFDLKFDKLDAPDEVKTDLDKLVDLNAIVKAVDPTAKWNTPFNLLRASDPRRFGVAARVSLDGFSQIKTATPPGGQGLTLTFFPGEVPQDVEVMVECTAVFTAGKSGPAIVGASFDGCARPSFDIREEDDIEISMSNLCHCAAVRDELPLTLAAVSGGSVKPKGAVLAEDLVIDDEEFVVNYELLAQPPAMDRRPVPYRESGAGGKVPECYRVARLQLESEG